MSTSHQEQNNNQEYSQDSTKGKEYPSAELLLSIIQHEYQNEASRKRDLETRTGILIALLGALVGLYTSTIDFTIFKKAETSIEYLGFSIIAIIYIFPLISFLISIKLFIDVLKTREYQRMGLDGINDKNAKQLIDVVSQKIVMGYKTVVINNDKSNNAKTKDFNKGIKYLYISLIGIVAAYMLKQVISLIT